MSAQGTGLMTARAFVPGNPADTAISGLVVDNQNQPLPAPIYMVKLNQASKVWAGPKDVALTLPEVPGFRLEIPAGSVSFPDGSREGYVSVTVVNSNTIPMTPPNVDAHLPGWERRKRVVASRIPQDTIRDAGHEEHHQRIHGRDR